MAEENWINNNLSAILLGRKDHSSKIVDEREKENSTPSISTPTNLIKTPSSNSIVQPIKVTSNGIKRVSFPVYLPQDLNQRFQVAVTQDGQKKSALVKTWIIEYLRQREQYDN